MAFIPGPGLAEVTLRFVQKDGELALNVFGVDTTHGADLSYSDCEALAESFVGWFSAGDGTHAYQDVVSNSAQLLDVTARDITTATGVSAVVAASVSGTDAGADLQNGVTFTLTARTGLAGRSFRGRSYLSCLTDAFVSGDDENVADSAKVSDMVAAFDAIIPAMTATILPDAATVPELCVFSRVSGGSARAAVLATPVAAYGYHDLFLDYQRRRAPGHNRHR